jgi:rhamnose transport system substrate-binding protein
MTSVCDGPRGDTIPTSETTTTPNSTAVSSAEATPTTIEGDARAITGAGSITSMLLPPCTNISVYAQTSSGAEEAAAELGSDPAEFVGPTDCGDATAQIPFITDAVTSGVDAIMLSNNSGGQMDAHAEAAADAGIPVVTWDSPIQSAAGERVFVAEVDFGETGMVMADMAASILGQDGGRFAILSGAVDSANQNAWIATMEEVLERPEYANLELVDTVYGNEEPEDSATAALGLVSSNPDLELIMAPTTVGIVAAAQTMTQEGLCESTKVSGLGLPEELAPYVESGCVPEFAWWSFTDLGFLTYHVTYGITTGQIEAKEGTAFIAGRLGRYEITADPTREAGLRVLMGPFSIYNADDPGT